MASSPYMESFETPRNRSPDLLTSQSAANAPYPPVADIDLRRAATTTGTSRGRTLPHYPSTTSLRSDFSYHPQPRPDSNGSDVYLQSADVVPLSGAARAKSRILARDRLGFVPSRNRMEREESHDTFMTAPEASRTEALTAGGVNPYGYNAGHSHEPHQVDNRSDRSEYSSDAEGADDLEIHELQPVPEPRMPAPGAVGQHNRPLTGNSSISWPVAGEDPEDIHRPGFRDAYADSQGMAHVSPAPPLGWGGSVQRSGSAADGGGFVDVELQDQQSKIESFKGSVQDKVEEIKGTIRRRGYAGKRRCCRCTRRCKILLGISLFLAIASLLAVLMGFLVKHGRQSRGDLPMPLTPTLSRMPTATGLDAAEQSSVLSVVVGATPLTTSTVAPSIGSVTTASISTSATPIISIADARTMLITQSGPLSLVATTINGIPTFVWAAATDMMTSDMSSLSSNSSFTMPRTSPATQYATVLSSLRATPVSATTISSLQTTITPSASSSQSRPAAISASNSTSTPDALAPTVPGIENGPSLSPTFPADGFHPPHVIPYAPYARRKLVSAGTNSSYVGSRSWQTEAAAYAAEAVPRV